MTDPLSDRPAYRQVADRLRPQIESGKWPAGYKLSSESELMDQFAVSRVTVRLALGALRAEGLILTRQGRGSFVRDRGVSRKLSSLRYQQDTQYAAGRVEEPATTYHAGPNDDQSRYRLERTFHETRANQQVADLLALSVGDPVLQRHYVYYVDERPEQISTSYLPMDLVRGTPVADPANEPWAGGTAAQLASLGKTVNRVAESVRARMPSPDEAQILRVAAGVPVLVVTRRMLTGPQRDQPVEASVDIVLPADRVVLDYVIDLHTVAETHDVSNDEDQHGNEPTSQESELHEISNWPIAIYLKDGSMAEGERVRLAVTQVLGDLGFDLLVEGDPILGSFWQKARAVSRRPETKRALSERMAKLEQAAEVHLLAVPESQANMQNAQGVAAIIEALRGESAAAIQLGPLLIVKIPNVDGQGTILCKTLTAVELKELERNPSLLSDPISLVSQLPSFSEPPAIE